ncbi:hypothetical protein SNE40_005177 [Patella caerulea]|uniref:Uncharacterized protein n=1 Tax=Patella caerulea TaxID=87958 RepID=A0AAN8PY33_PATCE
MAEKVTRRACSICLSDFKKPRIIDCHHSFCEKCLDSYMKTSTRDNTFPCPMCRQQISAPKGGAKAFAMNFYIDDESERNCKPEPCGMCKTSNTSQFRCKDCDRYLCSSCKSMHDTLPPCIGHHVVTLDATILGDAKQKEKKNCQKHSDSCLEFYCRACKQVICMKCLMTRHKDHKTSDIVDVWSETAKELKEIEAVLEDTIAQLEENSVSISDNIIKIQSYVVKSCERVDQQVQKICTAAQKAGDDLKTRLHIAFDEEEEKMKKLLKGTEDGAKELRINAQCVADMIQNEQMVKAVEGLPTLRSRIEEINLVEIDIPELSFISFKEYKIDMSQLGTIIVNPAVTFHHDFFLNQFKKKGRNNEIESRDIKQDGLVWYLTVDKEQTGMTFGIGLANENIKSLSGRYTLTLTNKRHRKSVKMSGYINFKKENSKTYISHTDVTWAQLCDPTQGFVDSKKRFTVKASVSVRNVQK